MLNTEKFGRALLEEGFDFFSGVPCSFLKNLINYCINHSNYIMAANEGDAVAMCAGAHLGGRKAVVLMQNSGLANAISPLTSLNYVFKIPVLGFVSLRGEIGVKDEPQHELMGVITTELLSTIKVDWEYLATAEEESYAQIRKASDFIQNGKSFFFVVRKDTFSREELDGERGSDPVSSERYESDSLNHLVTRLQALEIIQKHKEKDIVFLATTGKTGRELYELGDCPNNFYMVGSMGCVSSMGLGLALTQPRKNIVVIDGDGSVLMRMGAMPVIGYYHPANLLHILLDNQCHDSTGGQRTVSSNVDFCKLAESCGYHLISSVNELNALDKAIQRWKETKKLSFVYLKIAKGSKKDLGRPKITPCEVKERVMAFMNEGGK